jgi:hypothetical protein
MSELRRDVLIRLGSRLSEVPGASIRIGHGIGDLGQRAVRATPFFRRGGVIDHRAQKRMPESHPRTELDEAGRLPERHGFDASSDTDAKPIDGPEYEHRIAHRLGSGHQQHPTRRVRQGRDLPPESLVDSPRQRGRTQPEAPC